MAKVRVGFIGAGQFVTASHLPTVVGSPDMQVGMIADINRETLTSHRKLLPDARFTTDYREVLHDPQIDLVVIGTRQDLHARLIVESLDAGKWVYCEKPMAETPEEIAAVLQAEDRSQGRLAIGLNRRFAPAYVDAKNLMKQTPRPWFLSYRLMAPHLTTGEKDDFYRNRPRIIYEGCHILDLVCWFLDDIPTRVFMTGDHGRNNCCILEFADGSNVSFLCGSIGSFCLWKEYMEFFAYGHSITISDFVDMRVRGFPGTFDRLYPLDGGAFADEISRFGFDYYEVCRAKEITFNAESMHLLGNARMAVEGVRRPLGWEGRQAVDAYCELKQPYYDSPDKGRRQALEHFAKCFQTGEVPQNSDGLAGARSTMIGMALLKSLDSGVPVAYDESFSRSL